MASVEFISLDPCSAIYSTILTLSSPFSIFATSIPEDKIGFGGMLGRDMDPDRDELSLNSIYLEGEQPFFRPIECSAVLLASVLTIGSSLFRMLLPRDIESWSLAVFASLESSSILPNVPKLSKEIGSGELFSLV